MKLILVRHGETEENKKHILQGRLPGKLSKEGIDQARKIALRLKEEEIDFIYASNLARASDTAKEIQKFHPKIRIIYNELLQETDFGDFTGKSKLKVDFSKSPNNMETPKQVQTRMLRFFNLIRNEEHMNKTILIVSHYGCIVALLTYFMGKPIEKMFEIKQGNTAVNIVNIEEDKNHKLHLINCTNHLN
jgi:broad specificity phosphatase PhoE